jgi:hypothetical protein
MDQVKRLKTKYGRGSDLAVARVKRIGRFERLTTEPLAEPAFVDQTIDLSAGMREPQEPAWGGSPLRADRLDPAGKPYRLGVYAYRVVAVNRLGVASGPSPFAFTYPSGVQHVFSKEEGEVAVRLRWKPNPEKGIRGYVVYRLDGRWDKDPISRLTAEPVAATEFVDPTAGKGTRRYEVVAVDALGQEGEPSRPVWSRREWWRFYVPYVGEWHQ